MEASFTSKGQGVRNQHHTLPLLQSAVTSAILYMVSSCAVAISLLLFYPQVALSQELEWRSNKAYELGMGYGSVFLADGDTWGQSFEFSIARRCFFKHSGLELRLSHQRAVDDEIRDAVFGGWADSRTYTADLTFYTDALRFQTGLVGHRLRFRGGPSVQSRTGEDSVLLLFPALIQDKPDVVDKIIESGTYDNVHRAELYGDDLPQEGTYALFTNDLEGVRLSAVLGLSYSIEWWRMVLGLEARAHAYSGGKTYAYGLNIGVKW